MLDTTVYSILTKREEECVESTKKEYLQNEERINAAQNAQELNILIVGQKVLLTKT